ncbi:hypothetical protein [Paractinoplanes rishiriensis]|uniref:Uncharacterized protein n=1 Tax=Paractinoplanes rishiriensis TaxID=1050105 RepID=A0A919JW18_9ACTN|nr:hypothetical protein [Actinoplanes rishiriensis]GIE94630.1 hypothetical protein Ari01nite_20950 [Actinoplanes rishiriensis]
MAETEGKATAQEPTEPAKETLFDEQADGDNQASAASGGERSRALDDSLSMFGARTSGVSVVGATVQIGTIIGRDGILAADDRDRPIVNLITDRAVVELGRVYVAPTGFAELGVPVGRTGLVLFGTRPRWGNTATATRLLDGVKAIYELRFAGALADLPVDQLPAGSGFILDATEARALNALRPQNLADLEERLRDAGSRLVVVTDADRAAEHGSRPVWRALATPPDAYELTVRHLEDRLASREQGEELLDQAEVTEQLRAMTPGAFDVHRLVELAADLAEVARGRGTLAEAVERFEARADQAVEQWFDSDELAEPHRKALVLALAVLNGMSFDAVSRAATLLERIWQAAEPGAAPGSRRPREPRGVRLKAARARLTHEWRSTRFGAAELEIASFWDNGYPERLLRHYWHEHDYDRDVLLEWLRQVADDVEVAVNVRAAGAVGFLATFAFDTVRRDVIAPWAGSGKGDERELAVAALAMPARRAETVARTIRLVADWASRDAQAPRMAAVRALGGSVGAVLDPGPDKLLARLAHGAEGRVATALGDSIGELLAAAEPDRQLTLVSLLASWSDEPRRGRQAAGVLGFLQAAWTQWQREGDGPAWPLLLRLADRDRSMSAEVATLWRRALVAPGADHGVRVVLRSWAFAAERDPELRRAFVELFMAVPRTERQANLLRHHAERLRTAKPATPDTARRLLEALTKAS